MIPNNGSGDDSDVEKEIHELEHRLTLAKLKRKVPHSPTRLTTTSLSIGQASSTHFLFLLADSALPLGSFAFSNGLESHLAHTRSPRRPPSLSTFLPASISSQAATQLPFCLAGHRQPATVAALDQVLDATILCTVGRRASISQGRALLSVWERAFAPTVDAPSLREFSALLKTHHVGDGPPPVAGHLAPLFGSVTACTGLTARQAAYVFVLGHVKAVVSAAVRAGVFGPYEAQRTLAGGMVQGWVAAMVEREWETSVEEAGQTVPMMDLWVGRHELLYSRIFNS